MIYVGGVLFAPDEGMDVLAALMENPLLVSASNSFKSMQEKKISLLDYSGSTMSNIHKWVYLFQREFATVNPALADGNKYQQLLYTLGLKDLEIILKSLVGTDEATTCIGIAIRNSKSGMISVAHMDFSRIVDVGLNQMLSLVAAHDSDAMLDVHLIGGYDDVSSSQHSYLVAKGHTKPDGFSYPLCEKIVKALMRRSEKFQIQTLHVLRHNTRWDSKGIAYPIFHGFVMETSTGSIIPASFDGTSRCPDEIVRRIRVTSSYDDPNWTGKLLDTYDTNNDQFVIAPCAWSIKQKHIALALQDLSDEEMLLSCSSSPSAEPPHFVDSERRKLEYLISYPDWRETFPSYKPRLFQRTADGTWLKK